MDQGPHSEAAKRGRSGNLTARQASRDQPGLRGQGFRDDEGSGGEDAMASQLPPLPFPETHPPPQDLTPGTPLTSLSHSHLGQGKPSLPRGPIQPLWKLGVGARALTEPGLGLRGPSTPRPRRRRMAGNRAKQSGAQRWPHQTQPQREKPREQLPVAARSVPVAQNEAWGNGCQDVQPVHPW